MLGALMPLWYIGSLVLSAVWAIAGRDRPGTGLVATAATLIVSVIMSVPLLFPISNRGKTWTPENRPADWRGQMNRWDRHHCVRGFLVVQRSRDVVMALIPGVLPVAGHGRAPGWAMPVEALAAFEDMADVSAHHGSVATGLGVHGPTATLPPVNGLPMTRETCKVAVAPARSLPPRSPRSRPDCRLGSFRHSPLGARRDKPWSGLSLPLANAPWHPSDSRIGLFGITKTRRRTGRGTCGREADAGRANRISGLAPALLIVSWAATAQLALVTVAARHRHHRHPARLCFGGCEDDDTTGPQAGSAPSAASGVSDATGPESSPSVDAREEAVPAAYEVFRDEYARALSEEAIDDYVRAVDEDTVAGMPLSDVAADGGWELALTDVRTVSSAGQVVSGAPRYSATEVTGLRTDTDIPTARVGDCMSVEDWRLRSREPHEEVQRRVRRIRPPRDR